MKFEIARGDDKLVVDFQGEEELYLEGVAFGQLYVIQGDRHIKATLYAGAPHEPLTEEEAVELAKGAMKARGLLGEGGHSYSLGPGTLRIRNYERDGQETCRVVIGLHTREVVDFRKRRRG